jgi:hypothetical protein
MYGGNRTGNWGNIVQVDSGMLVDSEGRVQGINVNLALNARHMDSVAVLMMLDYFLIY